MGAPLASMGETSEWVITENKTFFNLHAIKILDISIYL